MTKRSNEIKQYLIESFEVVEQGIAEQMGEAFVSLILVTKDGSILGCSQITKKRTNPIRSTEG